MKKENFIQVNNYIVIESLRADDIKTGRQLYDDIISRRVSQAGIKANYCEVKSKAEFKAALTDVLDIAKRGDKPYIHFEIHGSKEGFEMNNGELVTWEEVAPLLRSINVERRNTLVVSLATCFGAHMFSILDPLHRAPFYMYLAPVKDESQGDLQYDFIEFFNELLTKFEFAAALDIMFRPDAPVKYMVYSSEMLFEHMVKMGLNYYDKRATTKRIWSQIAGEPRIKNRSDTKKELKKLVKDRPAQLRQMKYKFLMKDLL